MLMNSIFGRNLFDDVFEPFYRTGTTYNNTNGAMRTDVKETDAGYELAIDLPGVNKEDVSAELEDGYLTVKATTSKDEDEKDDNGKYIRRERLYGTYSRSFYVGDAVTENDIKAHFENGTLELMVPKKEAVPEVEQKKLIAIEG